MRNRDTSMIVLFAAILTVLGTVTLVGPGNDPTKWILGVLGLAAAVYLLRYLMPSRAEVRRNQVTFRFLTGRTVVVTSAELATARVQGRPAAVVLRRRGDVGFSVKFNAWDEPGVLAEALAAIVRAPLVSRCAGHVGGDPNPRGQPGGVLVATPEYSH